MPSCASDSACSFDRLRAWLLPALLAITVLQGCATHSEAFRSIEQHAVARNIPAAIETLERQHKRDLMHTDVVLKHLNKGTLLHLQGDYAGSNREFDEAKRRMEELDAISVREQAGAMLVNEAVKAYVGDGNEQMLVYAFAALNYLQMGNIEDAAVEARQFDVKHRLIREKHADENFLSGAFVRYLNGMVFEAIGDTDDARIEYKHALAGYQAQSGFSRAGVPVMLTSDIARLTAERPRSSKYSRRPSRQPVQTPASNTGEVVFVLENGLGPSLGENLTQVPNPKPQQGLTVFRIALPTFVERPAPVARMIVAGNGQSADGEMVEDINALARKSLEDRLPGIKARAVARLLLKNQMVAESKKQEQREANNPNIDPMAKALRSIFNAVADVGATMSERADTRTWSLLPGNILMARLQLPAGPHDLSVSFHGANGNLIATRSYRNVLVQPGKKTFVADYFY